MGGVEIGIETLRKAYCPPLDDALFSALAFDYDLPQDYYNFVKVLDNLKPDAVAEENTTFDPSGTGGGISQQHDRTDLSRITPEETSTSNDLTSLSTDLTEIRLVDTIHDGKDTTLLSDKEQQRWLQDLFPSLPADQIHQVLQTTTSPDQAIEELLNFSFLANDADNIGGQELPRGIDGFVEDVRGLRRKGRGKIKARTTDSSRASSTSSYGSGTPASLNAWNTAAADVEFICSKTTLQPHVVRSVYHANGANLSLTIRAFADKEGAKWKKLTKIDDMFEQQIAEIKPNFSTVPDAQVYGLLLLARNHPSAACELLQAMTAEGRVDPTPIGKIHGFAQYAPLEFEPKAVSSVSYRDEPWMTVTGSTRHTAAAQNLAVSQAFAQASGAYRKSKSNNLYGGAAAYYSEVGREKLKAAKELSAAQANTRVDSQSKGTMLDLHGIDVQNAVRIAKYKTQVWWDSLGDAKYVSGGGEPARAGYRIVTGVGTHSKNHAPRIGPAVFKTLSNEGWKVEAQHGEVLVTGRRRR